jgi:hypothetical protein
VEAVPTPKENLLLMLYFLEKGHLKRIQTVLFSGLAFCAKMRLSAGCRAHPGQTGTRYGRKNEGVPEGGKI